MKKLILTVLVLLACFGISNATVVSCATFKGTTWTTSDTALANGNFTIDTSVSIGAFFMPAGQTYTITETGTNTITLNNSGIAWKDSSTGLKQHPDSIAFVGNGARMLLAGVSGVIFAAGTSLYFGGTNDTLVDNKTYVCKRIYVGAAASLVRAGANSTNIRSVTTPITVGNSGSFTVSTATTFAQSAAGKFHEIGTGCTFNGTANCTWQVRGTVSDTFPAFTYTGTGINLITDGSAGGAYSIYITGTVNTGTAGLRMYKAETNNGTFYTGGNAITCGPFAFGGDNATGTATLVRGASTITMTSYLGTTYATGTIIDSMGSSTNICSGPYTLSTAHTIVRGTSLIKKTPAANTRTLLAGKKIYDYELAASVAGVRDTLLTGNDTVNNLTVTTGSLVQNLPLVIQGNYVRNSSDTSFMGGQKTISGDFTLGASAGPNAGTDTTLTIFSGAGNSVITLNGKQVGRMRVKKSTSAATVSFANAGRLKTLIDSTGIVRLPNATALTIDSILSVDDSIHAVSGSTIQDSGATTIFGANAKPNLRGLLSFIGKKAQTLTNAITKTIGNISVNKSAEGLTISGFTRYDTLRLLDGYYKQTNPTDTQYCSMFIDSTTDSTVLIAPIVVTGNVIIASGAKMGYSGAGKIIVRKKGATVSLNGNTGVPPIVCDSSTTINGGGTMARLSKATGGVKVTLEANKRVTLTACDSVDLSGKTPTRDSIMSSAAAQRCTLDLPATRGFSWLFLKDVHVLNPDTLRCMRRDSCLSGGGNF